MSWFPIFVLIPYVICIGHITSYLSRNILPVLLVLRSFVLVVHIIFIGRITVYLACNFSSIFHIFSFTVNDWCINSFLVCNLIFFSVPSSFCLFHFVSEYTLNRNCIRIYVTSFLTQTIYNFPSPLNFWFLCCIGLLYEIVSVVCVLYDVLYACCIFVLCFSCCILCVLLECFEHVVFSCYIFCPIWT